MSSQRIAMITIYVEISKHFLYQNKIFLQSFNNIGFVICMGLGLKKVTFHPARDSKL